MKKIGWAAMLLVLSSSGFSPTAGQSGARSVNIGQHKTWELSSACDFPVWVALNSSPGPNYVPKRNIFLFLRAADFTEANLGKVFTEFASQFPEPVWLMITAFSNQGMLDRIIRMDRSAGYLDFSNTPEGNEGRRKNEELYPPKTGFFRAYYSRSGNGQQSFQYNPNPDVDKLVNVTLKQRADDNYRGDLESDLLLAANKGDVSKIRELLAQGVDVNSNDSQGDTPLLRAKNLETVEFLLGQGARVDDRNNYGFTALIRASGLGQGNVVQALLEGGADINSKNKYGNTALMSAAMNGCVKVVEILLRSGADTTATNNRGKTAMMFARDAGQAVIVHRLEAAGVHR